MESDFDRIETAREHTIENSSEYEEWRDRKQGEPPRSYNSENTLAGIERGLGYIRSHPDFEQIDLATAGSDAIADVLHALNSSGLFRESEEDQAWELLERAWHCYVGDFEDE